MNGARQAAALVSSTLPSIRSLLCVRPVQCSRRSTSQMCLLGPVVNVPAIAAHKGLRGEVPFVLREDRPDHSSPALGLDTEPAGVGCPA
jgi:hypothetical protein